MKIPSESSADKASSAVELSDEVLAAIFRVTVASRIRRRLRELTPRNLRKGARYVTRLSFSVSRSGVVDYVQLLEPSSSVMLNKTALSVVRDMRDFNFPASVNSSRIEMTIYLGWGARTGKLASAGAKLIAGSNRELM